MAIMSLAAAKHRLPVMVIYKDCLPFFSSDRVRDARDVF